MPLSNNSYSETENNENKRKKQFSTKLHQAAKHNKSDKAKELIECGADKEAKDLDGSTPLHVAVKCNSRDVVDLLLKNKVKTNVKDKQKKTAIHWATEKNSLEILNKLLQHSEDDNENIPENGAFDDKICLRNKSTDDWWSNENLYFFSDYTKVQPIHIAAHNGYLECLNLLIKYGADVRSKDGTGKTPLHLAAAFGKIKIVEVLLQHGKDLINEGDENKITSLHLAVRNENILELLIKAGGNVNIIDKDGRSPISYAAEKGQVGPIRLLLSNGAYSTLKDNTKKLPVHYAAMNGHSELIRLFGSEKSVDIDGKNCLDLAIDNKHAETVLTIFQINEDWKTMLRRSTENFETPMRKLIRYMPDVAREVFNQCTKCEGTGDSFKVHFDYRFLDDELLLNEWTTNSASENEERKKFADDTNEYNQQQDRQKSKDNNEVENKEDQTEDDKYKDGDVKFDDDVNVEDDRKSKDHQEKSAETTRKTPKGQPYTLDSNFRKKNHPLMIMVDSRRRELLSHPLVSALLKRKWSGVGYIIHSLNFVIYAAFLAMLTGFALDIKVPYKFRNVTTKADYICPNEGIVEDIPVFASVAKYAVIGFALLELLIEILDMRLIFSGEHWRYFIEIENVFEWITCIGAILFVVNINGCSDTGFRPQWQWTCGAVSVFLAWMNLLFIIQKFDWIGIYVVMLFRIVKVFMKFFLVFSLLIVAFAVLFHCLFQNQEQFSTFGISLVKTTVMMIGELDFSTMFLDEQVHYDFITYAFFYLFILFMTIVVINLLVGLAVDNIQEFQKQAHLAKKEMQVKFALELERLSTNSRFLTAINLRHRQKGQTELKETINPKEQNWLQRKVCESWHLTENDIKAALKSDFDCSTKETARLDAKLKTLESNLKTKMQNIDSNMAEILKTKMQNIDSYLVEILRRLDRESIPTDSNKSKREATNESKAKHSLISLKIKKMT